jgi:polysaccharide biosynthesis protein PslG
MRRSLLLTLVIALTVAPGARADWNYELGIGEQQLAMFSDPRFLALGLDHVRVVTAYDVVCHPGPERNYLDAWLAGARASRARPLVAFSFSPRPGHRWRLPSYRRYLQCFRAFRKRYPQVRDFNAWNEANHSAQPTFRHPRKAAGFYNAIRRACPRCTLAAGDLLDWYNLESWLERYRPHLRGRPRLWSIHNYIDVNSGRPWRETGLRKLLDLTRGSIWITETAGVVISPRFETYDENRAAVATKRMFKLAGRSHRVTRLYGYQWQAGCDRYAWDSGWFRSNGTARPAWRVVLEAVARDRGLDAAWVEELDLGRWPTLHDTCAGVE